MTSLMNKGERFYTRCDRYGVVQQYDRHIQYLYVNITQ